MFVRKGRIWLTHNVLDAAFALMDKKRYLNITYQVGSVSLLYSVFLLRVIALCADLNVNRRSNHLRFSEKTLIKMFVEEGYMS